MDVVGPPLLGRCMRYPLLGSAVLFILNLAAALVFVIYFVGGGSRLLDYVDVFLLLMQMPFLLSVFYGFWLLSRYFVVGLLGYAVIFSVVFYVLFIASACFFTWLDIDPGFVVPAGLMVVEGLLVIVFSVGVIQLREGLGYSASVLGVALFFQGLFTVTVLLYIVGGLMNLVTYPLMTYFFYQAYKKFSVVGVVEPKAT